jgi:hypothetical protein
MKTKVLKLLAFCLLFLSVVIPNSLQLTTGAFLVATAAAALLVFRLFKRIPDLMKLYGFTVLVTLIYILVGQLNYAPVIAAQQIATVYIVSPLLWMIVAGGVLSKVPEEILEKWFVWLTFAALISICIYFYLFLTDGPDAVKFFIDEANVDISDGTIGATMFVYGSLIFLAGGLFAAPGVVQSGVLRMVLLCGLGIAAITSGRSALMIAIPIGLAVGSLFGLKFSEAAPYKSRIKRILTSPVFYLFVAAGACLLAAVLLGLDLQKMASDVVDKILSGGGDERSSQTWGLLLGTLSTLGLGAGHGVGISLIRSEEFPWRYETVWMATIFRAGLIGAFIYALPFFLYIKKFFYLRRKGVLTQFDLFLFSGFVASFIAANTNPYIEAFSFQWMFVFPMVSLALKSKEWRNSVNETVAA